MKTTNSMLASVPIYYSRKLFHHETDADGICNHSNYFRIAEEAFFYFLDSLGIPLNQLPITLVVTKTQAIYKTPLKFNDLFKVRIQI